MTYLYFITAIDRVKYYKFSKKVEVIVVQYKKKICTLQIVKASISGRSDFRAQALF
jgi:hypothetical protein